MRPEYTSVQDILNCFDAGIITKAEARALISEYFPLLGKLAVAKETQ